MNRPLRFRVWDTKARRWIGLEAFVGDGYGDLNEACDDVIVTQYTGLKDSKGRDIYEGDIVRDTWQVNNPYGYCPDDWDDRDEVYEVKYIDSFFSLKDRHGDGGQYCVQGFRREVIGNIFENPDLLK